MPIFMDRHDIPGVTAKDVALAHQADLKVQHEYGCRGLTYWFDEDRGIAFCLVEAPKKESVEAMHNQAHGLVPHQIIEVDTRLVESFLGRIKDADHVDHTESFIKETALRVLMLTDLRDSALMESIYGREKAAELFEKHNFIIRKQITDQEGREIELPGSGFLASFTSITSAVHCAHNILEEINVFNRTIPRGGLQLSIGLNAGMPVTEQPTLFGQAVQLIRRMCYLPGTGKIMVSSEASEMVKREDISILDNRKLIRILRPKDENFLNKLMNTFDQHWEDSKFGVEDLCRDIGVSKSQLNRMVKSLSGYSPNEFIREYRLRKASELLDQKKGNISEITFASGFSSPSYFSKCFFRRFGILPSKMISFNP